MTTEQFDAFLKDAGYSAECEKSGRGGSFTFKDRDWIFVAQAYDDNPELLHIVCRTDLSGDADRQRLDDIMRALELEYPIVKLRELTEQSVIGFEVSAEQLEPDEAAVKQVFWKTLDVLRSASIEVLSRLREAPTTPSPGTPAAATPVPATPAPDPNAEWRAHLEDSLRNGSRQVDKDAASVSARIRASLALVLLPDASSGTAFCIKSNSDASYYVTDAHVLGDSKTPTLYRQFPVFEKMTGSILATGATNGIDLAVVSVPTGNIPAVTLSPDVLDCDGPVALAGYARVQMWAADMLGEVAPAIHVGTVTAVNKQGSVVMHDAISRPGDSGGPLFEPATGNVVGIEKSGWQDEETGCGIGIPVLEAFLIDSGVGALPASR